MNILIGSLLILALAFPAWADEKKPAPPSPQEQIRLLSDLAKENDQARDYAVREKIATRVRRLRAALISSLLSA